MRSSFKINSSSQKNNNDGQWMPKKRKREETSRISLPGSSQKSPKRTKLTPDGKYNSLTTRQNEQFEDEDIQSSPHDLQITSSPITLSPIKAPKSPTQSQLDVSNFEEIDRIESSPVESSNRVPEVKLDRHDSITLLRQSNDEFLAAALRRTKTTTPDKKARLSPSSLKLPSSQSPPKNIKVNSPPVLPTRVHRSQPVPRKLEQEFDEEIEDDIVESEEQVRYNESKLMVSNIEEIDAAFKGDEIEDEIDSSPIAAVSKFSPLVKHQNDILKQMRDNAKVPIMPSLNDSIEESQESQHLDEMLTMESTHRTPTKVQSTQQADIEDIEEHDEDAFDRTDSPPPGQQVNEDYIADSPDHVPESPPMHRRSPDVFENKNLRLLVDDVDEEDDIFTATLKEEKEEAREVSAGPIKFNLVNSARAAESLPQQPETWNTADKIRGSFISPLKRTQQPVLLKEGLRIKPAQGPAPDQTFLNKISVNSGQFTQFVPNEENTGRKGLSHLVKGGLAERMAKLTEIDKHKRKHVTNQLKNGESFTEQPIRVKVIKVKSVFNHLSVAKCRLESSGEHVTVAFKHEKENVEVDLPQVVEGIKLALIPPYYSLNIGEQGSLSSILMAAMYVQLDHAEDDQDDMLSEESEGSPLTATEKLFSVYANIAEYLFEPMQLVPVTMPNEHETLKEDSLRVFVQRVVLQNFAPSPSASAAELTKQKSRAKPLLGDLCDGFFLNKLKQLQISQYNTDKVSAATVLGCRLVAQSSPNTVTVIDVKNVAKWYVLWSVRVQSNLGASEAMLQCEGKWFNIKGLVRADKLPIGGVSFGRVVDHLHSTDEFTCTVDANTSAAINHVPASLVTLDKLSSHQGTAASVLGKVLFSEADNTSLSMSVGDARMVYVTDGKTVASIRVQNDQPLTEGKVYIFIDVYNRDNCWHTSDYSAIEEVRWVKKSSVNYHNTNTLPGKRLFSQGVMTREIGYDDTLCAALGIDPRAIDGAAVPVPRTLTSSTLARVSVKSAAVEAQLLCTYCRADLEPLAPNTELALALALHAQQPQFKCAQCRTIQSAERATKAFKVQGECQLENKTVARQLYVAAALVEQWTEKHKRNKAPSAVVAEHVAQCLCTISKEPRGLRVDVIKSIV